MSTKARELAELSRTIVDTSDATAITINANEEVTLADDLFLADGKKVVFGAGEDLLIFHDGANSHIRDQGTGNLIIRGNNLSLQTFGGASYFEAAVGGAVELYHNDDKKLETTSTGIDVTGLLSTTGSIRAAGDAVPTTGAGVELVFSSNIGNITSYDRSNSAYRHLNINGSSLDFKISNSNALSIDSSSNATFVGSVSTDTIQNASGNLSILSTQNILLKFDSDNDQTNRELNIQNNNGDQILQITETGTATFSGKITSTELTITGGTDGEDIYINNTSPTLGFTDSNSFSDPSDVYLIRGASSGKLQFQFKDDSAGTTTQTFLIDQSGNTDIAGTLSSGAITSSGSVTAGGDLLTPSGLKVASHPVVGFSAITGGYAANLGSTGTSTLNETHIYSGGHRRVVIDGSGNVLAGTTSTALNTSSSESGHNLFNHGYAVHSRDGQTVMSLNRLSNDGTVVDFRKDGSTVGSLQTRAGVVTTLVLNPASGNGAGLSGGTKAVVPADEAGIIDNDISLGVSTHRFKALHLSGTANLDKIRITNTSDASLSSTDHAIQIGTTSGQNLIIDNNELSSRNNGAAATLNLQVDGGTVTVGAATSARLTVSGSLATSSLFENKFANGNVAAPNTADHTAGTRQVYYDTSATAWYARGIEGNTLWDNVDQDYKLYRQAALRLQWSESSQGFLPGTDNAYDLGSTSKRWRDVYTGDVITGGGGTSATGEIQFKADSVRARIVGGYDTGGGGYIAFRTDTTGGTDLERARFTNAGNLKFANGNGIDFSATSSHAGATSVLFDDYEEGVFGTSFNCSVSGSITLHGSYNNMQYTKIGRLVTVTGYFIVSSVSSPNGVLQITVPFQSLNVASNSSSVDLSFNVLSTGSLTDAWGIIDHNSNTINVYVGSGTSVSTSFANRIVSGTDLRLTATYIAA